MRRLWRRFGHICREIRTRGSTVGKEGELYRLFHEINSLAAILNAHAENEAKSREFMKDTIADISHQLKTPLAALNIYNGILQGEAENLPEIREFTDLSEQELDRIETLVQNLLKIAKLDAGTIVMEKAEESVPEMMWALEKQFACRAELEDKTLTFSGEDGVTLNCDRSWFLEAAGNLVKNAFDHTEKGGAIRVEWRQFAAGGPDNGEGRRERNPSGRSPSYLQALLPEPFFKGYERDWPGPSACESSCGDARGYH